MKIIFRLSRYILLTAFSFLSFSCLWNPDNSSYRNGHLLNLISPSGEKINTDYLFMMYLDGDNNLNDVSYNNLMQAKNGLKIKNGNASITVLALIDGNISSKGGKTMDGKSHLYILEASVATDYSRYIDWVYLNGSQEVNMASGNTLYNFLYEASSSFNAKNTILIMHNHGSGPLNEISTSISQDSARALCYDDTNGNNGYLTSSDIALAVNRTFGKIDMLVEDVCLECSIEAIYGLKNNIHYLVASPNSTLTNTYNYDRIISYASSGPSIEDIGKRFIDYNYEICKYLALNNNSSLYCKELSLTLVDCSKTDILENIKMHTSQLYSAISDSDAGSQQCFRYLLGENLTTSYFRGFIFPAACGRTADLGLMAYLLANKTTDGNVKTAAENLYSDLKNGGLIVYAWAGGTSNNWYYSSAPDYGKKDFLKISDGKCPWGISITSGMQVKYSGQYKGWSLFAKNNNWSYLFENLGVN